MNEVVDSLLTRRSIRSFKPDMPSKELIRQVVEAGLYAASGMGRQSAMVLVITNPKVRKEIGVDNGLGQMDGDGFYGAPVVLAVLGRKDISTHVYDGSLMLGNMMNAAHALGLGSCWIHRCKEEFETEKYKQLLKDHGVEGQWEGIGHLALGYPAGKAPEAAPRAQGRVVWIE